MTALPWQDLDDALGRAHAAGRGVRLWWRDDDAIAPTPALERLLGLRRKHDLPLLLAVIPARADDALFERLETEDRVWVGVHGYAHENHAPKGEKKQELGPHRSRKAVLDQLSLGHDRLAIMAGGRLLPVLVPPWNRIDPALLADLADTRLTCLSTFGKPPADRAGLTWLNTHLDPVDWRGARGLADPAGLIGHFVRLIDDREDPIGLLTHHLVHDAAVWGFVEDFLARMAAHPFVTWPEIPALI